MPCWTAGEPLAGGAAGFRTAAAAAAATSLLPGSSMPGAAAAAAAAAGLPPAARLQPWASAGFASAAAEHTGHSVAQKVGSGVGSMSGTHPASGSAAGHVLRGRLLLGAQPPGGLLRSFPPRSLPHARASLLACCMPCLPHAHTPNPCAALRLRSWRRRRTMWGPRCWRRWLGWPPR